MPLPFIPQKPEVMSPAGYWPQLRAAIEAGADSVYFGLKHFTARAKVGFTLAELPEVMQTLHGRGVKGFVTFNTLVFEHELAEAVRVLEGIARAGADAIIVQDAGVVTLAREIAPDIEIHGSTQMSIANAEGVAFARRLGVDRVTLARELSLSEIRAIRERTDCELEIFVHGALCVAYSGQCFSSEAWGGRSANRGQCAQACRLPYDLVVDGRHQPLEDARYLLSPGDLMALHHMPEIVCMGISALKIEGRYKDADYVALTTREYRRAVDEAWEGAPLSITPKAELQLEQIYSRGLGDYWISGTDHQRVVNGRAPRHRGVLMGRVVRATQDAITVHPSDAHAIAPLKPGDGVVFDAASWRSPEEAEEGGRVFEVTRSGRDLTVRFGRGAIDARRIREGDLLWRTHDPETDKVVKPLLEPSAPVHKQRVGVHVAATAGEPLRMAWRLGNITVEVSSDAALAVSLNRPLTTEFLTEQLGRLGNTPYELGDLTAVIEGSPFVPSSLLNELRRSAVELLQQRQSAPREMRYGDAKRVLESALSRIGRVEAAARPQLHLLVRDGKQLDAAIGARPSSITLDYLDLYGLKPSVDHVKAAGVPVRVATPRMVKPGEERIADFLLRLDVPVLVRSAGMLELLRGCAHELTGDFSFNAANSVTADLFLRSGLARLSPTYDLNADQVRRLAESIGGARIEAIAYSHLPVFHTEHCVFCRFLSTGTSYKDCGRPCDTHKLALRDGAGREHAVIADVGCRNTVFGAEAQDASSHLHTWLEAGVGHYRVEFVHETAEQVARVAAAFQSTLEGRTPAQQLAIELRRIAPQGTTQGSLFVPSGYDALPVLQ